MTRKNRTKTEWLQDTNRSERDSLVLSAQRKYFETYAYAGLSAIDAFHNFVERLDGNPPEGEEILSPQDAKQILSDPAAFARTILEADRRRQKQIQEEIKAGENKDIADIKRSVATKTTLAVAAFFCLVSPFVTKLEEPTVDWAKDIITTQYHNVQKIFDQIRQEKVEPAHPKKVTGIRMPETKKALP